MGVTSTALLLACIALVAYDNTHRAHHPDARHRHAGRCGRRHQHRRGVVQRRQGGATETLSAVAVNKNVRMAAILRNGAVFARFDRQPETTATPDRGAGRARISCARLAPSSPSTSTRCGWCGRFMLDGELIGGVYHRVGPRRAPRTAAPAAQHHRRRPVRRARRRLRAVVEAAAADLRADPASHRGDPSRLARQELRHPRREGRRRRGRRADRRLQRDVVRDSAPRPQAARSAGRARPTRSTSAPPTCGQANAELLDRARQGDGQAAGQRASFWPT